MASRQVIFCHMVSKLGDILTSCIRGICELLQNGPAAGYSTEMDFIVDPRLPVISAWPCLVVA